MNPEDFYRIFLRHPQICTDSRKITPGCLYFALKGDRFDGNAFAAEAIEMGSAYAIVDDPARVKDDRFILVSDTLLFLQELASHHRSQLSIPVIGLTGTNGKTTTKELVHNVLKQRYNTVATAGNLNNHIGVPITLLTASADTQVIIVEMGANHPGEISFLCNLAKPTAGLITNIGMAHLEGFGSFDGVVRTKNELYDWIKSKNGKLFVNEDDSLLKELAGGFPSTTYGTGTEAGIRGEAVREGRYLSVNWGIRGSGEVNPVDTRLSGDYNLYNILAAVTIGVHFGLSAGQIRTGIESYIPGNMRSQWMKTARNTLFLDAYNANPSSMALAINHFASLNLAKSVAVLGDMFELGSHAEEEHRKIIRQAGDLGFEKLLFAGPQFYRFSAEFPHLFFESTKKLSDYLSQNIIEGCHILIKGSRGMQLESVVGHL